MLDPRVADLKHARWDSLDKAVPASTGYPKAYSMNMVVTMEGSEYPRPNVLLARLMQSQGNEVSGDDPLIENPPSEESLSRLAGRIGLQLDDLLVIAGLAIPDGALRFDEAASRELPTLVRRALTLPAPSRQRMRDFARSLTEMPQSVSPRRARSFEQYPPGFGALLVQMLALRNLGWSAAAQVMYLMSGVYVSAATIGAVGRGVRELDAELLDGFAAVLGVPVTVLKYLTGMHQAAPSRRHPAEVIDAAALLWDVRHLTAAQVLQVSRLP